MKLNQTRNQNQTLDSTVIGFSGNVADQTQPLPVDTLGQPALQRQETTHSVRERKRLGDIYENMNLNEFAALKTNAFQSWIDKERLKIKVRSNPNQQYESTSYHEVFEIRDRENIRTGVKETF